MDVLTELRAATGPLHARIERLPIAGAMLAGAVTRAAYARLLGGLFHTYAAFEDGLGGAAEVAAVWPETPSRRLALARDLGAFGADPGTAPAAVGEWADALAASGQPAAWAGAGYVFEGSRMGSRMLVRSIARGFGLDPRPGVGLDFHLDAGPDPVGSWKRVTAALEALGGDPAPRAALVAAAVRTFELLYALHEDAMEPAGRAVPEPVG
jgi:heme oxygenase